MMMISSIYTLVSLMGYIVGISSFMIGAPLSGVISEHHTMHSVERGIFYKMIKNMEVASLVSDAPKHVVDELHECREMCRDTEQFPDLCFSIILENGKKIPDYIFAYRKKTPKGRNITIYTIEAFLLNSQEKPDISILNVFDILDVFTSENRGYVQLYPLKNWRNGRYYSCLLLERSMKEIKVESFEDPISFE